jgi:hypothetical protein
MATYQITLYGSGSDDRDRARTVDAKCPFRNFLNRVNRLDSMEVT